MCLLRIYLLQILTSEMKSLKYIIIVTYFDQTNILNVHHFFKVSTSLSFTCSIKRRYNWKFENKIKAVQMQDMHILVFSFCKKMASKLMTMILLIQYIRFLASLIILFIRNNLLSFLTLLFFLNTKMLLLATMLLVDVQI